MAKIYPDGRTFDVTAVRIEQMLRDGNRAGAKALALERLSTGTALRETQMLAAKLFSAKRGRPATGMYRWVDIGEAWKARSLAGERYESIIAALAGEFGRGTDHIEKCITQYKRATAMD